MLARVVVLVLDDSDQPLWTYERSQTLPGTMAPVIDAERRALETLELVSRFSTESVEQITAQANRDLEDIRKMNPT